VERNPDLLELATDALRDEEVSGVSQALIARTQARVRAISPNVEPDARLPFRHPMFRVAAAVAMASCAVALYAALKSKPAPVQTVQTPPTAESVSPSRESDRPTVLVPPADGAVRGVVRFAGVAPQPQVLSMAANAVCAAHHRGQVIDESVLVNANGTLRNVVVWVSGGLKNRRFSPPAEPAVLDQVGCVYTPHVVAVMVGQRLLVKNSDPFLHNVRAAAVNNPPVNIGQPTVDGGRPLVFLAPDRLLVKCDIHPWMTAYVHVRENPFFAVSGTDGSFKLPDLPPGKYEFTAWHEVFGEQRQTVSVEAGKPLKLEFTFRPTEHADAAW
jgi:hypothetical protein